MKKLLCLYQVMFQYRVGTYEAMAQLPNVDFELWHGKDVANTKKKNFKGKVGFRHKQLRSIQLPFKTNNGKGVMPIFPFLFFKLIRYNPDVILTEGTSNLWASSVAYIYTRLFRKKIIWWSLGDLAGRNHKGVRSMLQRWISHVERNCDAIWAYSTQAKNVFLADGVLEEKIFVGVNVIDTSQREAEANMVHDKDDGFNVVFVGAINKTKRIELLVDAVEKISSVRNNVCLHIVGDGNYLQNIKDYVHGKKDKINVIFHGRVTDGLGSLISRYQVMVLPGLGGLAIVDGMACSLPIITGPADGTELDLINDKCGFVTTNMTEDYIVEKLLVLYDNPNLRQSMGEESFRRITTECSFENYMNKFVDCIKYVNHEE